LIRFNQNTVQKTTVGNNQGPAWSFDARKDAPDFIDGVALADEVRDDICSDNAARFLTLKGG
jgi:predicted TIM-barrel fold metal-dependent hydrolase